MLRILPAVVLVALLSGGCASTSKTMQSWMGIHQSNLILQWGPPTRSAPDGAGGTILIYEFDRYLGQVPGRAVRNFDGSVSYTAPESTGYVAVRMFWVNANGILYHWQWRGM